MYYKTHLKLNKTKTKTALANHYQVDRATLNKWLKLFSNTEPFCVNKTNPLSN